VHARPHKADITHLKACARLKYEYRECDHDYPGTRLLLPASQLQGLQVLDVTDVRWGICQEPSGSTTAHHMQPAATPAATLAATLASLTRLRMCGISKLVSRSALAGLINLADLETCASAAKCAGPVRSP
jgi:hypothetical protein